ncbi:MAG: alpha/beta hydrolase [Pirellulaceae bacterium]
MHRRLTAALVLPLLISCAVLAQERQRNRTYPPKLKGAKVETYKTIGDVKLDVNIFFPEDHKPTDRRPAIVFFFGGGWRSGSPAQFEQQCRHLAERGMVAMTADYRVSSRHGTTADACVSDGKSAVRWIRQNAERLGVDPQRVVAGGGSAGGHVAACTGTIAGFEESDEDISISSKPNAMALFNPAVVLAPIEGQYPIEAERQQELRKRMGVDPRELSPYHHVSQDVPPTIIFHGVADTTVPYKTVQLFESAIKKAGARCELEGYEGRAHGFFNYGREGGSYEATVKALDKFLAALGYLEQERDE